MRVAADEELVLQLCQTGSFEQKLQVLFAVEAGGAQLHPHRQLLTSLAADAVASLERENCWPLLALMDELGLPDAALESARTQWRSSNEETLRGVLLRSLGSSTTMTGQSFTAEQGRSSVQRYFRSLFQMNVTRSSYGDAVQLLAEHSDHAVRVLLGDRGYRSALGSASPPALTKSDWRQAGGHAWMNGWKPGKRARARHGAASELRIYLDR